MNERAKQVALVVVILIAAVLVVNSAKDSFGEQKMIIDNVVKMPEGHQSEKERMLAGSTGSPDPAPFDANRKVETKPNR